MGFGHKLRRLHHSEISPRDGRCGPGAGVARWLVAGARSPVMTDSHLLIIGGRSGVGKSTVAFALHDLLVERDVQHAVIEGDALDLAHPAPWRHGLAQRNLQSVWANYRELGYRRLIYTNTVSVLEEEALVAAVGGAPQVTSVLLRGSETTVADRLGRRDSGESLERHLTRSARAAQFLDDDVGTHVHRIDTDGRSPEDIAEELAVIVGW